MPRGRRARLGSAAVGAALLALALPRGNVALFGWIGLAPLFFAVNAARSRREAALAGLLAGAVYHAVVLHWIDATCRFADIPEPVGVIVVAVLAGFLALNWAFVAAGGYWLGASVARWLRPLLWATLWVAVESACARWTPRLGVDVMSYTQGSNRALLQACSWGGPHLVSFLVVFVNAALAEACLAPGVKAPLWSALALSVLVWVHGIFVLRHRPTTFGPTGRVEILQPNIDQYRKWDTARVREILDGFEELQSRARSAPPSLVVWPETSLPRFVDRAEAAAEAAKHAKALKATHLIGILAVSESGFGGANGVQLIRPDGKAGGFYAKRELVPYGEYVPFRAAIPRYIIEHWLQILDQFGDMEPGQKAQALLTTPFGPTAVTICYEAMFPRWARRDAARGARLLVNVTNDAWYKETWGPYQHYAANSLRAIENRIWTIRSGNTGISAVIDPWGFTVAELPLGARGRLDVNVPLDDPFPKRSFFTRHGDWFGALCLVLSALAFLKNWLRRA